MKRREMLKCLLTTGGPAAAGFQLPLANAKNPRKAIRIRARRWRLGTDRYL